MWKEQGELQLHPRYRCFILVNKNAMLMLWVMYGRPVTVQDIQRKVYKVRYERGTHTLPHVLLLVDVTVSESDSREVE